VSPLKGANIEPSTILYRLFIYLILRVNFRSYISTLRKSPLGIDLSEKTRKH
jgi:hypothetical protein